MHGGAVDPGTTMTPPAQLGLDVPRLSSWLQHAQPEFAEQLDGPLSASLIAGGKSNLTFELTDGRSCWILRRPPVGRLLATAHDMAREYRVMSSLRDTPVPVPQTIALCTDTSILGGPFYLMERVVGTPYRYARELVELGPNRVRVISCALVDTLARLHDVDPVVVGLADFGRPEGFLTRQLERWRTQLEASRSRALPAAESLYAALATRVGEASERGGTASPGRLVHGDYRLDNLLIDDLDQPAALIDWELASRGEPLCDLALLIVYGRFDSLRTGPAIIDAASAPGYLSERELIERYASQSGSNLAGFGLHLGLACYKVAAIAEGIHFRFRNGQTVGPGFESLGDCVVPVLESGHTLMKEYT